MSKYFTTEITSDEIVSDNVIHQRLLFPYIKSVDFVKGDLLEIGCGIGRGVETLKDKVSSYTAVDKIGPLVEELQKKYPEATFKQMNIPPFEGIADNSFDCIITFQVIEHIKKDELFVQEIYRMLKPGGFAIITTPNIAYTLSRNPWHIREYTVPEMFAILDKNFDKVEHKGVAGSVKVLEYHERNRASVKKFQKIDVFNLEKILPRFILRVPYDILNRRNRKKLMQGGQDELVKNITWEDFSLSDDPNLGLDHFCICHKKA